jgi:zinc and cadmium transporter
VIGIIVIGYPMAKLKKVLVCFMAFSVGILLGDAFLHLLPEATEENGFSLIISCGIMGGIFL